MHVITPGCLRVSEIEEVLRDRLVLVFALEGMVLIFKNKETMMQRPTLAC